MLNKYKVKRFVCFKVLNPLGKVNYFGFGLIFTVLISPPLGWLETVSSIFQDLDFYGSL